MLQSARNCDEEAELLNTTEQQLWEFLFLYWKFSINTICKDLKLWLTILTYIDFKRFKICHEQIFRENYFWYQPRKSYLILMSDLSVDEILFLTQSFIKQIIEYASRIIWYFCKTYAKLQYYVYILCRIANIHMLRLKRDSLVIYHMSHLMDNVVRLNKL